MFLVEPVLDVNHLVVR